LYELYNITHTQLLTFSTSLFMYLTDINVCLTIYINLQPVTSSKVTYKYMCTITDE